MRKKPLIDQLHHEDSWRLFRILAEFVEGFEALAEPEEVVAALKAVS
jgi:hypothetical protein